MVVRNPPDTAEFMAGGTDLMERRRSGVSAVPATRLPVAEGMRAIAWRPDGGARLGAAVTIDALAKDARIVAAYPGLAAAAGGLATPEIRRMATVGGNLTQRSRCWYFRNPELPCLKKGGTTCPARTGNHLYGVVFDRGACVAPHPSTLGAALLTYEAQVDTSVRRLSIGDMFGDGRDGARDHVLAGGELVVAIDLPSPVTQERAHYARAIARAHAEWPLVEIVVRWGVTDGRVSLARIALGGVAPVPFRLVTVEAGLLGASIADLDPAALGELATAGANPLPQTGYKIDLIRGLVTDALARIAAMP